MVGLRRIVERDTAQAVDDGGELRGRQDARHGNGCGSGLTLDRRPSTLGAQPEARRGLVETPAAEEPCVVGDVEPAELRVR